MFDNADEKGLLKKGSRIIEPTFENTGIALVVTAAARDHRLRIVISETMREEYRRLLKAYGAELVLTEDARNIKGAIAKAENPTKKIPGSFAPGCFSTQPISGRTLKASLRKFARIRTKRPIFLSQKPEQTERRPESRAFTKFRI